MVYLLPIAAVSIGLLCLLDRDLVWDMTAWQRRRLGVPPVRTEEWDTSTTVEGVFLIGLGVFIIVLILFHG